jgi:hypothetical protein
MQSPPKVVAVYFLSRMKVRENTIVTGHQGGEQTFVG